jgi:hypothetical protein
VPHYPGATSVHGTSFGTIQIAPANPTFADPLNPMTTPENLLMNLRPPS